MIKKKNQIFKCQKCGNMVEAIHTGAGELICCGEAMEEITSNTQEKVPTEKHIPVIKRDGNVLTITIGETLHPMDENHFIEWIEVISGPTIHRRYLQPGQTPETNFVCRAETFGVRAYCNIHGLWEKK